MGEIPRIRFRGFTSDWEQRRLGKIGTLKNGMNFSKDAMGHGYAFVNLQNLFGNNVVNVQNLGLAEASEKQLREYSLLKGDVLFVRSSVKLEGVGEAALVPENLENTTYSGFIIRFRDEYGLNDNFKRYVFSTKKVREQIMAQATNSANKNISQTVLENLTFDIPSCEEQKKIGQYFFNLDQLIILHQRKCDNAKELKKYMLQKMFPKGGEKVPEIRFAGFTDNWAQRKLGDVAGRTYGGGTPKTDVVEYWDGNIPWIQSSNLIEHELFNFDIKKYITDEGLAKSAAQLVPPNSIAVVSHVGVGKLIFMPFKYTTSQDFISLSELKAEPIFTCYSIYKRLQNDIHIVQGSAIKGITKDDLLSKEILLPSKPEQTKIGMYFRNLDELITLHQRKCDALKEVKKFMLQNMFPQKG